MPPLIAIGQAAPQEVVQMFARVSTFQGGTVDAEEALRNVREQVLPAAEQLDGFAGMLILVGQDAGRTMSITLWGTEEQMRASEEAANRLRAESTEVTGDEIVSVERFEVALDVKR